MYKIKTTVKEYIFDYKINFYLKNWSLKKFGFTNNKENALNIKKYGFVKYFILANMKRRYAKSLIIIKSVK